VAVRTGPARPSSIHQHQPVSAKREAEDNVSRVLGSPGDATTARLSVTNSQSTRATSSLIRSPAGISHIPPGALCRRADCITMPQRNATGLPAAEQRIVT
jgi:hypothetical protein